jgi:hypothetical protein
MRKMSAGKKSSGGGLTLVAHPAGECGNVCGGEKEAVDHTASELPFISLRSRAVWRSDAGYS